MAGGEMSDSRVLRRDARTFSRIVQRACACATILIVASLVAISADAAPVPVIFGPTTLCPTGSALLEAPAGYDSYSWFKDGVSVGGSARTHTATDAGTYTVVVSSAGGTATSAEKVVTADCAPVPQVYWLHVDDTAAGNGDRMVEPRESFDLDVSLVNLGPTGLTGVTATLSPSDAEVVVHRGTSTYADLAAGAVGRNEQPFEITAACGPSLNFTLTLFSAEGTFDVPLTLAFPAPGADWRASGPVDPQPAFLSQVVYDSRRGTLMMFENNSRWDWDGAHWILAARASGPRYPFAVAFDPVRDVVVALEPDYVGGTPVARTWEYSVASGSWSLRQDVPPASVPNAAAAAYDLNRGVIVAFGGNGISSDHPTYEFDGESWRLVTTLHSPPARLLHHMAFDPARSVVVIAGGASQSNPFLSDTWEFDGIDWRQGPSLPPRQGSGLGLAYSPLHGGIVAAFGTGSDGVSAATFVRTDSAWTESKAPGPYPGSTCLAFDERRRRLVAVGDLGNVYENDGSEWTARALERPEGADSISTYDEMRKVTVVLPVFHSYSVATYPPLAAALWDGGSWRLIPGSRPPAQAMTWAGFMAATIAVDASGNTFKFDGTAWSQIVTATKPLPAGSPVLYEFALATDSARQRVVLFGGYRFVNSVQAFVNDTWEFDGANWARITAANAPAPRSHAAMAFDARRNVSVLFGGRSQTAAGASVTFGDVWEWNGTDWSQRVFASPAPPAGDDSKLVYDRAAEAVFAWGGSSGTRGWLWNGTAWTEGVSTPHAPSGYHMALSYDSARNTLVATNGATTYERAAPAFCSLSPHADLSVPSEPGSCGAHVYYSIEVSGPCSYTATPASGSLFPVGVTRVVATTACGDETSFNVTVGPSYACPVTFTDDPIVPGQTIIKAVHIRELRERIDALRAAAHLAPGAYSPVGASFGISAQHIIELRTALDGAREASGRAPVVYERPTLLPGMTVLAVDISELRAGAR